MNGLKRRQGLEFERRRNVFKQKGPVDGACGWKGDAKSDEFVGAAEGYGEREIPGQGWELPAGQIWGAHIRLGLGTG